MGSYIVSAWIFLLLSVGFREILCFNFFSLILYGVDKWLCFWVPSYVTSF